MSAFRKCQLPEVPRRGHDIAEVVAAPFGDRTAGGARRSTQVLGACATVVASDDGLIELDDGRRVRAAVSCLVMPEAGDRVLVSDEPGLVLAVLQRAPGQSARLTVPGASGMAIRQSDIAIEAMDHLALRSLRDAELSAATGALRLTARNLYTTVLHSLIETAADRISQLGSLSTTVRTLLRLHSCHSIVTADKQIRIDAEQIHMG